MSLIDADSQVLECTRVYLALFFTFVAAFYTARILFLKQREQRDFVFPGNACSGTWWNHLAFRVFRVLIWGVCVFRVPFPGLDTALVMFPGLESAAVIGTGVVLLSLSFAYVLVVHFSMHMSWRSGIDPGGPTTLMTGGFYKYSRNPMFLGVSLAQLGFFLALPSLFSLLCLCIGQVFLHRQIRSEERHLAQLFPDTYPAYCRKVGRWLTLRPGSAH